MEDVKICQSCSMPMAEEELHGKNSDGSKNEDYCYYCFENGAFSNPNETLESMIEICIPFLIEDGTCPDADSARKMMQEFLPPLKRWKKTA